MHRGWSLRWQWPCYPRIRRRFYNILTNVTSVKDILLAGLALMLVFEGILPFIAPGAWREAFRRIIELSDGQLRFIGLSSIAIGVLLLLMVT